MKRVYNIFAIIAAMLLMTQRAAAWTLHAGTYYFDNTNTKWSKVYIRMGTTSWCNVFQMSKVPGNNNLYSITFNTDQNNYDAVQFASTDGYKVTDPKDCIDNCGIYNGNMIGANDGNEKTDYVKENLEVAYPLFVPTSTISNKYRVLTETAGHNKGFALPNDLTVNTLTLGGTSVSEGGTVGYFNPGQSVNIAGSTVLSYSGSVTAPSPNNVHATLNYYISGSTYSMLTATGNGSTTKTVSNTSIKLPTSTGQYTMKAYFKCGGAESSKRTAYYHIVGMTTSKSSLAFGAIKAGTTKSIDVDLTNVWNGSGTCTVAAELEGAGAGHFGLSTDDVSVTNKSGRVTVTFQPAGGAVSADVTAELVLTLPYNNTSLTKRIPISGSIIGDQIKVNVAQDPTFNSGLTVTLYGNMKSSGCPASGITEYGFFYDTSSHPDNELTPASTPGTKLTSSNASPAGPVAGSIWSATTTALTENTTYYYRTYATANFSGSKTYFSSEKSFTVGKGTCNYVLGDTVYVTIDKKLVSNVPCELKYNNFKQAIALIKGEPFTTSNALNYPVVFEVVPYDGDEYIYVDGSDNAGYATGGGAYDLPSIWFEDINNTSSPNYELIIRSANKNKKPVIQHPTIHNSRKIIFDNVRIQGSKTAGGTTGKYDNALEIRCDVTLNKENEPQWQNISSGKYPSSGDAGIVIKHCYIWSKGFTCVHVAGYKGVDFEDNDIEADLALDELTADAKTNTLQWGSSIKILQCEKFKFIRNSFRGSHATSLWLQGLKKGLVMNNVFWNNNDLYVEAYENATAFLRLVTQFNTPGGGSSQQGNYHDDIGIYYNTMYLAHNGSVSGTRYVDFFRLGSNAVTGGLNIYNSQNTIADIHFKYNNCYSYDTKSVKGANINNATEADRWYQGSSDNAWCESIQYNNFWSAYDETLANPTTSVFLIPTTCDPNTQYFVNVMDLVCATASSDPSSLVIKGSGLNLGSAITTDKSTLGANAMFNDRLHPSNGSDAIRKTDGKWTLGAYQQTEPGGGGDDDSGVVKEIIWWGDAEGDETNWDNRNNWRKNDGKASRLTCVDFLSTDLKIIIPAPNSNNYPVPAETGITHYPVVPRKFGGDRTGLLSETVNAGQGLTIPDKFAGSIYIESGGVLKGVQYLTDDEARRYSDATTNFTAGRQHWVLVGTVVMKFTDENQNEVRLLQSGDFYLDLRPNVYMSEASVSMSDDTPVFSWGDPFSNLWEDVPYNKVFSILIPNEYGEKRYSAKTYKRVYNVEYDPTEKQTYESTGWFLNDNLTPEYDTNGSPTLFCNTLPANIDVKRAQTKNNGNIYFMDYSSSIRSFVHPADIASKSYEVKSGNGFLFVPGPSNDDFFRITDDILNSTSTEYKSSEIQPPFVSINVYNTNGGGSVASVVLDELKDDVYTKGVDLNNVISQSVPELGIDRYGRNLDYAVIPSFNEPIPLIVETRSTSTIGFSIYGIYDIERVILVDRETGSQYDLLENGPVNIKLSKGEYRNRFYLNLSVREDDIPTVIDDINSDGVNASQGIDIYSDSKDIVISSSERVELKEAYITDLSGNTKTFKLSNAHYNRLSPNCTQGVYIINAVGDIASKTEKVIIK